VPGPWLVT
jgi:hypothetical protein